MSILIRPDCKRRRIVVTSAAIAAVAGSSITAPSVLAMSDDLAAAVLAATKGQPVRAEKVTLDIAPLVENGNTVPVTITVDSPMTAGDHVLSIALFNERNPQREVASFTLGPRAGRASVSTRIRLATSQKLVAIVHTSDGAYWSASADVIVAIAACLEGDD